MASKEEDKTNNYTYSILIIIVIIVVIAFLVYYFAYPHNVKPVTAPISVPKINTDLNSALESISI